MQTADNTNRFVRLAAQRAKKAAKSKRKTSQVIYRLTP